MVRVIPRINSFFTDIERDYIQSQLRTHGAVIPPKPVPPTFGGRINFSNSLALTLSGTLVVDHILCILSHDFPTLEFSPMVPSICQLLAHFCIGEDDLLAMMVSVIKVNFGKSNDASSMSSANSGKNSKNEQPTETSFYFSTTSKDFLLLNRSFGNLLYSTNKKLHAHTVSLHSGSPKPFWTRWLADLFIDVIPQRGLWRLLDIYMVDGYRALFQFGIALLNKFKADILRLDSVSKLNDFFHSESPIYNDPTVLADIFNDASKISVKSLNIKNVVNHHPTLAGISSEDLLNPSMYRYQRGLPKFITSLVGSVGKSKIEASSESISGKRQANQDLLATSTVIESDYWIALWSWIPPQKRLDSIELIFTTREHGTHISTMYRLTEGVSPMILIIETLKGNIFGAYLSQPWKSGDTNEGKFYGNGMPWVRDLICR